MGVQYTKVSNEWIDLPLQEKENLEAEVKVSNAGFALAIQAAKENLDEKVTHYMKKKTLWERSEAQVGGFEVPI